MKLLKLNYQVLLFMSLFIFNACGNPGNSAENTGYGMSDKLYADEFFKLTNQKADGKCEFIFTNKGDLPLIINSVRASCGCTAPDWTREPVLPGKTWVIKAAYNTQIPGAFTKTITVYSNAVNSPVILTIKGDVLRKN